MANTRTFFSKATRATVGVVLCWAGVGAAVRLPATVAAAAILLLTARFTAAQQPARYSARFADGTRQTGDELRDWHVATEQPKLGDTELLSDENPLRWLRDGRRLPSPRQGPYVEMHTGDCLPGRVERQVAGDRQPFAPQLDHLLVEPTVTLKPPQPGRTRVRVATRFVRRIVWQPRGVDYQPGTLLFRDGRQLRFRGLRFADHQVRVLTDEGPRAASLDELAELHLPALPFWDAYLDELAVLSPSLDTRLIQLEGAGGLRVTGSLDRFRPHVSGNPRDPDRWIHGVQPAWSLDMLWIAHNTVWVRRLFGATEVPLSRLPPQTPASHSGLPVRPRQVDRNARGGALRGGDHDFGWGFGLHGGSELRFALPGFVASFQTQAGLDRAAGSGGCVRFSIDLETESAAGRTTSRTLFTGPPLVGSEQVVDSGSLNLSGGRHLILRVDPMNVTAPDGADPLEIRDLADWFDPLLTLDEARLRAALQLRPDWHQPAWRDWTRFAQPAPSPAGAPPHRKRSAHAKGPLHLESAWDELAESPGAYVTEVAAASGPLRLHRRWKLKSTDRWLLVAVSQSGPREPPIKIEVRIDGEWVATHDVPLRDRGHRELVPLLVSLSDYHASDQPLEVEVRQVREDLPEANEPLPPEATAGIRWHALAAVAEPPMLHELLEDDAAVTAVVVNPAPTDEPQNARPRWVGDRYSGTRSLEITSAAAASIPLAQPAPIRANPQWGQYRYLRMALRKAEPGQVTVQVHSDDGNGIYTAGQIKPDDPAARRVWSQRLPDEWIVITRDLFADFGEMDLRSLTVSTSGGTPARVDHLYLARTTADFARIDAPSPEETNRLARRELAKPALERALPAVVQLALPDGLSAAGVLISSEGHVLTSGHVAAAQRDKGQPWMVRLSGGETLSGRSLGIDRTRDLALIQASAKKELPFVSISTADALPPESLVIGVCPRDAAAPANNDESTPPAHLVSLRRVFRGTIWTDFDLAGGTSGGPLLDSEGRLLGIHSRRSRHGGFLYARTHQLEKDLEKLRQGEVWGDWIGGTGPVLGLVVQSTVAGCRVDEITPRGPASRAGVRVDDILTHVDGRPVVSLDDIYAALADNDPGQHVAVRWRSGIVEKSASLKLVARQP